MRHFLNDLRAGFEARPSRPAIVYRARPITYGELDLAARRCAGWLQGMGVSPGDRVALFAAEKMPFLAAHLGVLYAGAALLPLNPRFTREEMRYFLEDSQASVVLAGAEQRQLIEGLAAELDRPSRVAPIELTLDPPATAFREPTVGPDDPCLILYSSGTTGWPKGVIHCHANSANSLCALADCWQLSTEDVVFNVLPLFHIHGLAFATHSTWLSGGCVWIEDQFDVKQTLAAAGQCTVLMAVPSIYYRLLDEPEFPRSAAAHWDRVRLFTCGSAPIRPEVLPQLEGILRKPVINRYGMTEAFVITSLPLGGPWPTGSVGLPLPGIERQVIGADGTPAKLGEVGTVVIRGPNLFCEYWRKPEATQTAFATGWFDTGDLGSLDEAGFLTLAGRKNDLIITSGYNVYPQVVERVLGECPGVRECAVLGIPDADRGEIVSAAVIRSDSSVDEKQLRHWCRERLIHYQQPRLFIFPESLPRNALGKILRRTLREWLENDRNQK